MTKRAVDVTVATLALVRTDGLSRMDIAAIGQSFIVVGVNIILVGCLASLLEADS